MRTRTADGLSVVEAVACLALIGVGLMATLPSVADLRASSLTSAGAGELVATLQSLRWRSAVQGRAHGLLFGEDGRGWFWREVRDGNGNGLRTSEVREGVDLTLSGPHRLEDRLSPVSLGFPPLGTIPRIPPAQGSIQDLDDPIRIGNTRLLSFTPLGSSTSGTLYVTDGRRRLYGVVLFGNTGRIRVWRYVAKTGSWIL